MEKQTDVQVSGHRKGRRGSLPTRARAQSQQHSSAMLCGSGSASVSPRFRSLEFSLVMDIFIFKIQVKSHALN